MLKSAKTYLVYFLILVYVSGAIGIFVKPSFFLPFTPYTLILTAVVFLIFQPLNKTSYLLGFTAISLIGFLVEVVGVKTGFIFGDYRYGSILGYKLFDVPLVISLNWAVLLSCGILLGSRLSKIRLMSALISAWVVTGIDYLMEQVVTSIDFWYFKNGNAGIHNYLGWFIISFITSFALQKNLSTGDRKIAYILLSLQVLFFGILNCYK